jgi:hypothetical protein
MRLEIRHLKRHQKPRARAQHRPIQELNKIAKLFVFSSHYKFVMYFKILLVNSKSIVDFISVIILAYSCKDI